MAFNGPRELTHPGSQAKHARAGFGARYAGFLLPDSAGTYSLSASLASAEERIKLWVDSVLLIDQWTSLAGTDRAATIALQAASIYEVVLEYSGVVSGAAGAGRSVPPTLAPRQSST